MAHQLEEDVQGCAPTDFVDARTGPDSNRRIDWDFSIVTNPKRCLLIQTGQSVTWQTTVGADLSVHPLTTQGGYSPNPIGYHEEGVSAVVTFTSPGTFGYKCLSHSPMIGAVKVVQATGGSQAPALPVPLVVGLFTALLIAGREVLRGRFARRESAKV